jgi:peptidoglycan hydrolase-like protein with peptidoglycan-binding domain
VTGSGVRTLQSAMNACYVTGLGTDGIFGENTEKAVKKVQIAVKVEVDGYYGPETRDAMSWPLTGGGCSRV